MVENISDVEYHIKIYLNLLPEGKDGNHGIQTGIDYGDGIGPEIVREAKKILDKFVKNITIHFTMRSFYWEGHPSMCVVYL